ncbi:hypothetical protein OEZ86_011286 [Tetradesmus obliquus]|nr:hypothetical protein OEZ86_011286 [Tetradesmus obliquus]
MLRDYSLARTHEFDSLMGSPFPLERNLTIQGAPGTWPTLDLNFAYEILEVCATCIVHLKGNLTIANDRRGTNPTYDFVVGKPGSRVWCDNVYRLRLACTSGNESAETIRRLPRSSLWPNPNAPQEVSVVDVTYKGKLYPDSMVVQDASFDVPYTHIEGRGQQGGYAQNCIAVTRLCEHYVEPACLRRDGPETCINRLIDTLTTEQQQRQRTGTSAAVLITAIVVPVVAVVALLVGMALFVRRRRRMQQQQLPSSVVGTDKGGTEAPPGTNRDSMQDDKLAKRGSGGSGAVAACHGPQGTGKDWQLISSYSNPHCGFGTDFDSVEFGEFVGSGSFGHVYQGTYCSRRVAVKVMEHSADAAEDIQNEMILQMSFRSRCVVAAYKCLTHARVGGGGGSSCESTTGEEFSLYVAPLSTCNSTSRSTYGSDPNASSRNSNQVNVPEWRGFHATAASAGSSGTPPLAAAGSAPHTSSRTSGEGQLQTTKLATWLLQEFCDLGTLRDYVVVRLGLPARLKAGEPEAMARLLQLLHDAATGLVALHAAKVVHGDLNCRNCLVASDPAASFGACAKVADLGVSRALQQHKTHRTTQNLGTITHTAPELLRFGRMSPASDIYSFGIMMHALYTGEQPFGKLLYGQFFETVVVNDLRPVVPDSMPQQYATLMEHCWATAPEQRPTAEQLLEALEYLKQQLPADMAQAAGQQHQQQQQPDSMQLLLIS